MRNKAQVLLKRYCTLGNLVNTIYKGNYVAMHRKNNICISCVFNGFKYVCKVSHIYKQVQNKLTAGSLFLIEVMAKLKLNNALVCYKYDIYAISYFTFYH